MWKRVEKNEEKRKREKEKEGVRGKVSGTNEVRDAGECARERARFYRKSFSTNGTSALRASTTDPIDRSIDPEPAARFLLIFPLSLLSSARKTIDRGGGGSLKLQLKENMVQ